jgi:hypothetical protein
MAIFDRLKQIRHAWNAFRDRELFPPLVYNEGVSYGGRRPDQRRLRFTNERTIVSSIYTRIGIDVAKLSVRHVRLDDQKRYLEDIDSGLQECLTVEANIDQAATAFRQDVALTLMDKGCIAIVPVDTDLNPNTTGGFDIKTLRVGEICGWSPSRVRVNLYNEKSGLREEIELDKKFVAIVENPLYNVMNEPNSTLQRLIHKLNLLDVVDDQSSSGKLDIIIQLPYVIKSEARRAQAEQRRKDIEFQLKGSQYGIAYTDGTEKVTQLNRPAENNLLDQVQYLVELLYSQLGITKAVMDGTADEATMINYYNRTINPIVNAITEAMKRSFLTKTARSQRQSVEAFRNPFDWVPISQMAEIADKFTRNEILSSNEIRQGMGIKPSQDPKADQLINSNMPQPAPAGVDPAAAPVDAGADAQFQSSIDGLNKQVDDIFKSLGVDENALG